MGTMWLNQLGGIDDPDAVSTVVQIFLGAAALLCLAAAGFCAVGRLLSTSSAPNEGTLQSTERPAEVAFVPSPMLRRKLRQQFLSTS